MQRKPPPVTVPDDLEPLVDLGNEGRPGISVAYLRRLVFERRVPFYKIARRVYLSRGDVEALIAAGRVEVGERPAVKSRASHVEAS